MTIQQQIISSEGIPKDLIFTKEILFDNCDFEITQPIPEPESAEYGACTFKLNGLNIRYRTAKITPTKTGQFVTLWKRIDKNPIEPFDSSDSIDLFVINTRENNQLGQFVFPMSILIEKGIVTHGNKEGKRAIRVYPPWDITTSKQAQKTQKWQLNYFLEIQRDKPLNITLAKKLFSSKNS